MTNRYLGNRWFRIGLFLVLLGWTPLWGIVLLAAIGLWPDPNPNPIGPGLLFFYRMAGHHLSCHWLSASPTQAGMTRR